jgi:cell division septum initiation protein DivIVA
LIQTDQDKAIKDSKDQQATIKALKEELKIAQSTVDSLSSDVDSLKAETKRLQFRTRTGSVFGEFGWAIF